MPDDQETPREQSKKRPAGAIEGSTTKEVFEAYVEHFLAPALREKQIVVMDDLSAHKGERVRRLIEDIGCALLYLPPYSPENARHVP